AGFERLYGDDIFDAGTHRVTRHTLGVGDHDAIGDISKDTTQRVNLSRSAATARGRVGLVRHENGLGRDFSPRNAAMRFRVVDQVFHDLADVLDIETSSMKCAVGGDGGEYLANRLNAAFTRGLGTFDDECSGAH